MKRVIIVHGWDFNSNMNWYPWLKKNLEEKGYKVVVPKMPKTSEPEIGTWVSHLKKIVGKLDGNTTIIGHSIGCQTIMRYLEKENFTGKINVLFVAGWFKLDNLEDKNVRSIADPWLKTPIDFNKVKSKVNKLVVFLSDNEPYGFVGYNKKMFEKNLGAKVIVLKDRGHFSEDTGVTKLPEILKFIK